MISKGTKMRPEYFSIKKRSMTTCLKIHQASVRAFEVAVAEGEERFLYVGSYGHATF